MFVAIIIIGVVVFILVTYGKKLKREREKERYQQWVKEKISERNETWKPEVITNCVDSVTQINGVYARELALCYYFDNKPIDFDYGSRFGKLQLVLKCSAKRVSWDITTMDYFKFSTSRDYSTTSARTIYHIEADDNVDFMGRSYLENLYYLVPTITKRLREEGYSFNQNLVTAFMEGKVIEVQFIKMEESHNTYNQFNYNHSSSDSTRNSREESQQKTESGRNRYNGNKRKRYSSFSEGDKNDNNWKPTSYYLGILGLDMSASWEDVVNAYRKMIRFFHPDNFNDNEKKRRDAEEQTKTINAAFDELKKRYRTS